LCDFVCHLFTSFAKAGKSLSIFVVTISGKKC
jgi:hypothetical protein